MGGVGSGTWYRFGTKTTVEECCSLDVGVLNRKGLLKPGCRFTASWFGAGRDVSSIAGIVLGKQHPELVILLYTHGRGANAEEEHVRQPVELGWTPCNFGGERPWFLCPGIGCGRRVAVLHAAGKYFICRHCYGLSYESPREDKAHRALRRAQKIRERLGGSANMICQRLLAHYPMSRTVVAPSGSRRMWKARLLCPATNDEPLSPHGITPFVASLVAP